MSLSLDLADPRGAFSPGEEIEVRAIWDLPEPPESIELRLAWHTSGKGDRDLKVVKTVSINSPVARDDQWLAIVLPNGPYSFSGKLISLVWGLELVAIPEEESTRREITIAPGGKEVLIGSARVNAAGGDDRDEFDSDFDDWKREH